MLFNYRSVRSPCPRTRQRDMSLSVQHLPLAGYAVTIGATLSKVLPVVFKRKMTPTTVAFLSMAAGGLALTWYHMILFFQKSFTDSGSSALPSCSRYSTTIPMLTILRT